MNVGVIGLGYVGLTWAVAAAANGINVEGIELNEQIKNCIKENRAHFYEPEIDNLIRRYNGKTLHVVDAFSESTDYTAFIITVGTPLKSTETGNKGKEPNFEYIKSAINSIRNVYTGSQLIILRSTVSVGTTRNIVLPFLAQLSGKKKSELLVAMCPERTIEGNAVSELTHLPQIISGNNQKSLEMAQNIFRKITPCVVEADSLEEAELIKLYCNTYRDMHFAIGNAFCMAAQEFGVDGVAAIRHANYGYHRSNIAMPGFVAGPCLEKDAYILINNMPECDSRAFILAGRKFNESLEDMVIRWVKKKIGEPGENKIIAISGMAFKGQPATSDLRGSSSVYIARKLKAAGYKMHIHDFVALSDEMEALQVGTYYDDLFEACREASLLLILNNHRKYETILPDPSILYAKGGFEILDSWGMCKELHYSENVKVSTLGNMFKEDAR